MSYYYDYYIGYRNKKTGKIYPLGPCNTDGKIVPAVSKSRSFASDLHRLFYTIQDENWSDSLHKYFEEPDYCPALAFLPASELPGGDFIKSGYFLIEDVERYERIKKEEGSVVDFIGFYDMLSPTVYAAKLKREIIFGKAKPEVDPDGGIIETHNASDYMYYSYPDYMSAEWEAELLREAIEMLWRYNAPSDDPTEYVVIKVEG